MDAVPYSRARAALADLFEDAIEHLPTRIDRRRAAPAVLISLEDLRTLLAGFEFHPEVLFEAEAVGIWLPELALWGRGGSFEEAGADLLDEIDELLEQLAASPRLRAAPNVVERLPWIFRLMHADTDDERLGMLFAKPAEEPRALAAATT
jgi:hypothetical protein